MEMSIQFRRLSEVRPPLAEAMDANRQRPDNRDIMDRKEAGETLNIGEKKFVEIIERAAKALISPPVELKYSVHEKTGKISIKLINQENKELIREIPPEKLLDIAARMCELAGLFVDERR